MYEHYLDSDCVGNKSISGSREVGEHQAFGGGGGDSMGGGGGVHTILSHVYEWYMILDECIVFYLYLDSL